MKISEVVVLVVVLLVVLGLGFILAFLSLGWGSSELLGEFEVEPLEWNSSHGLTRDLGCGWGTEDMRCPGFWNESLAWERGYRQCQKDYSVKEVSEE